MYIRFGIAAAVVILAIILAVALAPVVAALVRAGYEVGRRQLGAAAEILKGARRRED